MLFSLLLALPLVVAGEISSDFTNMGTAIACHSKGAEPTHLSCASGFTNTSKAECLALCAEFDGTNQADAAEMHDAFGCAPPHAPPDNGVSCMYASWTREGGGTCHLDTESACATFRPASPSAVVYKFTPATSPESTPEPSPTAIKR